MYIIQHLIEINRKILGGMPLNKSTKANKMNFACVPCVLRDQKSFHSKKFVNSVYYFLTSIQVRYFCTLSVYNSKQ